MAESDDNTIRHELRSEIEAAILPWATSPDKPPYSGEELVVMATMCNDDPVSIRDIVIWIIRHFEYYKHIIATCFWATASHSEYGGSPSEEAVELRCIIKDALMLVELPLEDIEEKEKSELSSKFPFFKLPAELRCIIYDMVFAYDAGIQIRDDSDRFSVLTEDYSQGFQFREWDNADRYGHAAFDDLPDFFAPSILHTRPLAQILAPLLVSKQFYNEAMPVFFRINRFVFCGLQELKTFLRGTARNRRNHIGRIAFSYCPFYAYKAVKVFKLLSTVEHLHELDIRIEEHRWLRIKDDEGKSKYPDILGVQGLTTLRSVRADIVNFHDCPVVEKMLKSEMIKPKSDKRRETWQQEEAEGARGRNQRAIGGWVYEEGEFGLNTAGESDLQPHGG